ncbi:asparagine synthase-related protein [Brevibacterium luteolum]|uniref:asparagine synthase-related protein n=1 Tax=Brevibacterium luteolum TaxID=199591 RepID=UPI0035CD214B
MIEAVRVRVERADALSCDASGGIDSSIILALASHERNDITAFTTGPAALFDEETSCTSP